MEGVEREREKRERSSLDSKRRGVGRDGLAGMFDPLYALAPTKCTRSGD